MRTTTPTLTPRLLAALAIPMALLLTLTMAAATAVGWHVTRLLLPDPGVKACRSLADGRLPAVPAGPAEITEEDYLRLRHTFAGSRHEDIREAGVRWVDLLWWTLTNPDLAALDLQAGRDITQAMAELSGACANHGVAVDYQP